MDVRGDEFGETSGGFELEGGLEVGGWGGGREEVGPEGLVTETGDVDVGELGGVVFGGGADCEWHFSCFGSWFFFLRRGGKGIEGGGRERVVVFEVGRGDYIDLFGRAVTAEMIAGTKDQGESRCGCRIGMGGIVIGTVGWDAGLVGVGCRDPTRV